MTKKVKRQGKTKGATSFILMKLGVLNENFKPNAYVKVSRKWAEENNIVDLGVCVGHSKTLSTDFSQVETVDSPTAKVKAAPIAEIVDPTPDFRMEEI